MPQGTALLRTCLGWRIAAQLKAQPPFEGTENSTRYSNYRYFYTNKVVYIPGTRCFDNMCWKFANVYKQQILLKGPSVACDENYEESSC